MYLDGQKVNTNSADCKDLKPDLEAARAFLGMLDPRAEKFLFMAIDNRAPDPSHAATRTFYAAFDSVAEELTDLNRRGHGIYLSVNETAGARRRKQDITRARACFRELDGPAFAVDIDPSVVVSTSPGHQHEWFFSDGLSLSDFEGVQRFLVDSAGSDPNARDLARVLRLPGYFHVKGDPFLVRVIGGNGKRYSADEIKDTFPPIYLSQGRSAIEGDLEFSEASLALVRSIIDAIPGSELIDRSAWKLTYGFALGRLGDGWFNENFEDIRLRLWEAMSRRAPGYEHGGTGCADAWDGVLREAADTRHERRATIRTLAGIARKHGWTIESSGIPAKLRPAAEESYNILMGFIPSPAEIERAMGEIGEMIAGMDPSLFVGFDPGTRTEGPSPDAEAGDRTHFSFKTAADAEPSNGREPEGQFRVLLPGDLRAHLKRQGPALVKGYLDAVGTTLAYGDSQTWKTFAIVDLFDRIAAGEPWAGRETKRGLCVIFAAESAMSVAKPVLAVKTKRHRCDDWPLVIVPEAPNLFRGSNDDPGDVKRIVRTVKALAERFKEPVRAVCVDTFAKATVGSDSNSDKDVGTIEARCDAVAQALQCQVILVHHTGKDTDRGARGSAAFGQNFPTVFEFARQKDRAGNDIRLIANEKQKDMELQPDVHLSIESVTIGENEAGEEIHMGVVTARTANGGEGAMTNELRLLDLVSREAMSKQADIAEALGISVGRINEIIQKARAQKLIEKTGTVYRLTLKGREHLNKAMGGLANDNFAIDFGGVEFMLPDSPCYEKNSP